MSRSGFKEQEQWCGKLSGVVSVVSAPKVLDRLSDWAWLKSNVSLNTSDLHTTAPQVVVIQRSGPRSLSRRLSVSMTTSLCRGKMDRESRAKSARVSCPRKGVHVAIGVGV
jgi:hypothetical protein